MAGSTGKKFSITIQVPDDVAAQWPDRSTAEKLINEVYAAMGGVPAAPGAGAPPRPRPARLLLLMVGLFALGVAGGYLGARFSPWMPGRTEQPVTASQPPAEPAPVVQIAPSESVPVADTPLAELAVPPADAPAAPPVTLPAPAVKAPVTLYNVQVGAFRVKENAELLVSQLRGDGFKAHVFQFGDLYMVQIGTFQTRDGATRLLAELRAKQYDAVIIQLSGTGN